MSYKTKQKEIILEVISRCKNDFTIKDIYDELNGTIGLTTIYRLVNDMVVNKELVKTLKNNNEAYYHYLEKCNCENHFYLKCDKCGRLEHVKCDYINELKEHVLKEHNFNLTKEKIFINGLCKKCSKGV